MTLPAIAIVDDLYVYANSINLAALPQTGTYKLEFKVTDKISDVSVERDLELASRVQATLLPPRDLDLGPWRGHYSYRPHGTVSGDYVDVIAADEPEGDVLVLLGDVSGKGVSASSTTCAN